MLKIKNNYTNKIFLIVVVSIVSVFLLFYYNVTAATGLVGADVAIKDKIQGTILLGYNSSINLTDTQIITTEFVNTGGSNYTAKIEVTIYMYNNTSGGLEQLANYYDNSVFLNPGERRAYKTIFLPSRVGVYYIKARVPYDSRTAEIWGSFYVTFTYVQIPQLIYVVTQYGGGTVPAQREVGITDLELDYKDKADMYPGQKVLLSVRLNNTGTINLHNLKFHSATTDSINFEVNPKEIYELKSNESSIFLISLELSNDIPEGQYDFSFEIMGLEVKKNGNIQLNVTSLAKKPLKDEIHETILNYEYLITELDHEIYTTSLNGFNTSRAETYLDNAKRNLQRARDYYNEGNYQDATDVLDSVKRDLENVVFELATISFRVYVYPAYSPFLVLILAIMVIIATLILIYLYRRRKKKRPKLIREFTEEET